MKSRINSNLRTVLTFILFVALMILVFVFYAQAQTKANTNVKEVTSISNAQKQDQSFYGIAVLPSELSQNQIKRMAIGESGFNTPGAMIVDENGRCYLKGNLTNETGDKIHEMKYGWIQIIRNKDGYYINVVKGEKTLWAREYIPYLRDKLESHELVPVKNIHIIVR
jgi:glucan-binding YG repeat protein